MHGSRAPWTPAVGASWQIVLKSPLKFGPDNEEPSIQPDVDVYDIDVYDNSAETIAKLHRLGKKVIGYFSAGTYEKWRPDSRQFGKADLGKPMDDWDERWVDVRSGNVRAIMAKRIQLAAEKGCDAIDPDNVDGYSHKNGFGLTKADSIDFIKFLSYEARRHGMSIGLKNAGEIISDVINVVDFQVNEQCVEYNEGQTFQAFIKANKPVFHIEYPKGAPGSVRAKTREKISNAKGTQGFSTVLKTMDLNGWVQLCDGRQFTTWTEESDDSGSDDDGSGSSDDE
ncbi:unnamed protein product [Clonostachys solani]|uniref:alpha-galactosidase n=1 Tax=Clonostachys solani TaxID=160281 RepID=A0A9N9YVG9_9HYPO|nr:unnamed protein product [Clonostachys solani]